MATEVRCVWNHFVDTGTELFSGRGSAVRNNDGDVGTLTDDLGGVVDTCGYVGGGVEVGCE
jgi:hypothetical protein